MNPAERNIGPNPETEKIITIRFGAIFTRMGKGNQEVQEVVTNVGKSGNMFCSAKLAQIDGDDCLEPEGTTEVSQIIKMVGQMEVGEVVRRYKNFFDKRGYPFDDQINVLIFQASQMPPRDIRVKS